ncbi:DNA-binding MarR family transcriptional regulator [Actinomadura pelletieri DSM 43383]|uniref:DNA-binding MarR family transcriptional regulator n=1 Tax=Actinomadura pelletieri DSM 43383 TaxID=1120940 RepID=A0A495QSN0_9ACTN|nr:MarR family transcriptional regulator [Actinomadura pelletieri]RKS76512.1 DNA-binding MarR family transcriptional regulator [Actinomadura pelletieri DSM 43383]
MTRSSGKRSADETSRETAGASDSDVPVDSAPEAVVDEPDEVERIVAEWRAERPGLDPGSIAVLGRVNRCGLLVRNLSNRLYDEYSINQSIFDVLAALRRMGPPYRKTARELAASSLLTSGGMTMRLDRMERDGLIRRVRSTDDRRSVFAELTPAGFALIDRIIDVHLERERQMLDTLTAEEQDELARLLRKLEHRLRELS